MAHYRAVGDIPPKRHTQHRGPDGRLYREELMGEEGFSSDSALLYHRGVPSAIVASEVWELPDQSRTPNHPLKPRHLRLHDLDDRRRRGQRPAARARQQRRPDRLRRHRDRTPRRTTATRSATSACTSRPGPARVETVLGVLTYRTGDYVVIPRATTHRWVPSEPSRLYAIEANSHIAPPKRYLSRYGQFLEHAPYCERDLHGPSEPFLVEGTDVEVLVKHRTQRGRGRHPDDLRDAPLRRGRLGRLPVALHVQHRGLHADHRQGAPAAAGAPGLRGPQLRGLQLPAAQGGLPPARDPGAVLPLQRRQRRGDVLRRRRLRGPQGLRASASARSRCTRAATRTARSRARSRPRSGPTSSRSPRSWSTPSPRSTSARAGSRSRTRRTPGRGVRTSETTSRAGP